MLELLDGLLGLHSAFQAFSASLLVILASHFSQLLETPENSQILPKTTIYNHLQLFLGSVKKGSECLLDLPVPPEDSPKCLCAAF